MSSALSMVFYLSTVIMWRTDTDYKRAPSTEPCSTPTARLHGASLHVMSTLYSRVQLVAQHGQKLSKVAQRSKITSNKDEVDMRHQSINRGDFFSAMFGFVSLALGAR